MSFEQHLRVRQLVVPGLEYFVGGRIFQINNCDAFLVTQKGKWHLFNVKTRNQSQTEGSVRAGRVFDSLHNWICLSVNEINVEIHINAANKQISLVFNCSSGILLFEVSFILDGYLPLSKVDNICKEKTLACSQIDFILPRCLGCLDYMTSSFKFDRLHFP